MVFFMESLKNKRSENQDSCCHMEIRVNHEARVEAFCVGDGMGGMDAGKDYSKRAVSLWFEGLVQLLMSEKFKGKSLKDQMDMLHHFSQNIFHRINEKLYGRGMDFGTVGGTTLSTAIHFWDTWIIANCGDSPVYMMVDGNLELISEIQNVAWQLVREDKTQVGSTLFYQNKNRLMEYLGRKDPVHPYCRILEDKRIQSILIGTDGVFGNLSMAKIENIWKQFDGQAEALTKIMEYARENGENDNQTGLLIFCQDDPENASEEEMDAYQEEEEASEPVYRQLEKDSFGERFWNRFLGKKKGGFD